MMYRRFSIDMQWFIIKSKPSYTTHHEFEPAGSMASVVDQTGEEVDLVVICV